METLRRGTRHSFYEGRNFIEGVCNSEIHLERAPSIKVMEKE